MQVNQKGLSFNTDDVNWRKSPHSGGGNDCIELAEFPGGVAFRDSENPDGPVLSFTNSQFSAFRQWVTDGALDHIGA